MFLAVLAIGDPGRIDRQSRWLRIVTGLLIITITIATAASAVRLVVGILQKADFTSPGQLLTIGAVVWITNAATPRPTHCPPTAGSATCASPATEAAPRTGS